jgi:tetratricopeptide (TPR) repeat protein
VESDVKGGHPDSARARLARLKMLGLGGVETDYWLGACQEVQGEFDAALATWARIPPGSPRFANATLRRARLAMERGRLSLAEEALGLAEFPAGSKAAELRAVMLEQIDLFTGRTDELRRRMRRRWSGAPEPVEVLRKLGMLDDPRTYAVGAIRSRLEGDHRAAPEDDRVWLGLANLAIHTADFAGAEAWLDRCLARRPEDPAVWRARLDWAMATDRLAEAVEALRHLPAQPADPDWLLGLRTWLAARRGDEAAEEESLARWLELVPGDSRALDRLSERAARSGRTAQLADLRRRKLEVDRATERYRKILNAGVPTGDFDELGQLAEALGRWFEARGWWTLTLRDPARASAAREALARLGRAEPAGPAAGGPRPRTLADLLADALPRDPSPPEGIARASVVSTFRDDAQAAGLRFVYENDPTPMCRMPETMGGGVGLLDFDGDGRLDIYAVQGGPLSNASSPPPVPQRDRLYRNRGDGTFEDVTVSAGLTAFPGGYGHGVAVGDYDNDGHPDLFITRWRSYALYRNRGDGTFEDATEAAGLGGGRDWPTSAAFADLDGDGDLDLYVCHYSAWDPESSPPCPHPSHPERSSYCGPRVFDARPDHVFRNDGGRFVDISGPAGVRAADREGRGLGVLAAQLDEDDRVDLFVANDLTANFLFRNRGGFRFDETAADSGVATNAEGGYLAGMGIAHGDFDGDSRLDLAVTNFYGESTTFYHNLGAGQFVDHTAAIGLRARTRYLLGFGTAYFDANNDGRLDLATSNGHVNDLRPNVPYAMPAQLLLGEPTGRLVDVSARAGAVWQVPRLGRGLACGDLDNDGRPDLLIVAEGTPLAYLHNQGPSGHFLTLQLEGSVPRSNRDAIGARVTVGAGGRRQYAQRVGGGSFLSANDPVDSVEVLWPSGHVDRYGSLAADSAYRLREGNPVPEGLRARISRRDAKGRRDAARTQTPSGKPS